MRLVRVFTGKELERLDYEGEDHSLLIPDPAVVFASDAAHLENAMLAP